jgi:hypothetical protein
LDSSFWTNAFSNFNSERIWCTFFHILFF